MKNAKIKVLFQQFRTQPADLGFNCEVTRGKKEPQRTI